MNESILPPRSGHDSLRLRHVLTIVLAGAVLGVGFNALQLSADSSRGLAWVKSGRTVVSLEGLSQAPRATYSRWSRLSISSCCCSRTSSGRPTSAAARGKRFLLWGGPLLPVWTEAWTQLI